MTEAPASPPISLATELAAELVAHRAGDRTAIGRLVRRATPVLWHAARAHGADRMTAEDAVQNALLALVRRSETIDDPQAALRWLVVTVQRQVSRLSRGTTPVELRPEHVETAPAAPEENPEQTALLNDRDRVLWQAVRRLSTRCQQLLRVIAFADRPHYAELAVELQMKVGSIGPTRARCLDKLRAELGADPRWERS